MKKNLLMIVVVSLLAMGLVACGTKENAESTVDNTEIQETVVDTEVVDEEIEGDAPIDETIDSGMSASESIDLSNTTMINIGENLNLTLEVPVFTFAYSEVKAGALGDTVSYQANNSEDDYYYEAYALVIVPEKTGTSPADSLARFEKYKADEETNGYEYVDIIGDVSSKYMVYCRLGQESTNGTILCVRDDYYIYDSTTCNTYKVTLRVNKDSALYGEDVLERSTADYREQLREAILAITN